MDAQDTDKATGEVGPVSPRCHSKRFWAFAIAAVVWVVFWAIPITLTATPEMCATCHEMKPYYDSWRASSHRAAAPNCLYCHAKPGLIDLVGFELGMYGKIAAHFAGVPVKTTVANSPSVESCSRGTCHSLNRETSNSGDLKINHRLHVVKAKIPCTRCHPGAVHAGVGGRLKLPPMKLCKECHADKMKDCGYCHTSPQQLKSGTVAH